VILENYRKIIKFGLITMGKLRIKKRNVVGDAGQINCSSFSNRTKDEAEGTAAHCRCRRARFGGFDTQDGIPGLVGGK
jgi:hypothetical protein